MKRQGEAVELDGTWELIYSQKGSDRLPDTLARRARLVVTAGAFFMRVGTDALRGAFRHGASGRPGQLDAVVEEGAARGALVLGLYRVDGCQLRLCLAAPGGERPRDVDSGDILHVWEARTEMVRLPDPWLKDP